MATGRSIGSAWFYRTTGFNISNITNGFRSGDIDVADVTLWTDFMFGPPPGEPVYKGAGDRSTRYLGVRTDADLYLGAKTLWP